MHSPRAAPSKPPVPLPSSDQLSQHDRRLRALEACLDEVKTAQASQQAQQAADRQAATRDTQALSQQFAQSPEALQRSQLMQREQLWQGVEDLKSVVSAGRGSDCSKKPRKDSGPEAAQQMDDAGSR